MHESRRGFTLIEAVLALVIFSLMASGFLYYTGRQGEEIEHLTDKTLATVVAENVFSGMRSGQWSQPTSFTSPVTAAALQDSRWPATGKTSRAIIMAKRQWQAYVDVEDGPYPNLRRVEVSVFRTDTVANEGALVKLDGYLSKN